MYNFVGNSSTCKCRPIRDMIAVLATPKHVWNLCFYNTFYSIRVQYTSLFIVFIYHTRKLMLQLQSISWKCHTGSWKKMYDINKVRFSNNFIKLLPVRFDKIRMSLLRYWIFWSFPVVTNLLYNLKNLNKRNHKKPWQYKIHFLHWSFSLRRILILYEKQIVEDNQYLLQK